MIATRLTLRDFRTYAAAEVELGPGLTVVTGRNGAGKTNLLEALYFACTGRSCRTANERECVRFGAQLTRLELRCEDEQGAHELSVGFQPGEPKRLRADGAPVERLTDVTARPLVSVFLPDRLELVTGAPALRRAHLDQVVAALRPARAATRRAYTRRARPAQRAGRRDPRRPRRPRLAPGLGRRARPPRDRADGRPRRRSSTSCGRASPSTPRASACPRTRTSSTGRARRPRPRRSSPPSWPSGSSPTSSAASPATGRTATTSSCAATAASCAPTARAASSGSGCSRCCSPSARRSPSPAARRR